MNRIQMSGVLCLACLSCAGPGTEPMEFAGEVRMMWFDDLESGESYREVWLEDSSGSIYTLDLEAGLPFVLNSGDQLTFEGVVDDDNWVAPNPSTVVHEPFMETQLRAGSTTENVLVIPVNVGKKSLSYGSGCSAAEVEKLYSTNSDSVENFYNGVSDGALNVTVDIGAAVSITAPSSSCDVHTIARWANAAYLADNGSKSMDGYNRRAYIIPKCAGWAGLAEVTAPGRTSKLWMTDTHACWQLAMAHELGHNFGMGHSSIASSEYGDWSDVMGNGWDPVDFHAAHKVEMGWVKASQIEDAVSGTEYELASLDGTDTTSTKVLRFTDSKGREFYVSYRTQEGWSVDLGSIYANQVSVHQEEDRKGHTLLEELLGETDSYTFSDSTLPKVTFDEIDGDMAVVTVGASTGTGGSTGSSSGGLPIGVVLRGGSLKTSGWAYDPDSPTTPLNVEVHVDGAKVATFVANKKFSKWRKLFPSAGAFHRFAGSFGRQSKGYHTAEVIARDVDSAGKETGKTTPLKPSWSFTMRR